MVHDQDRHADHARYEHIDEVDQHRDQCARQQLRFDEGIGVLWKKDILAETGQRFRERDRQPGIDPLNQDLHGSSLQDPERAHQQQCA